MPKKNPSSIELGFFLGNVTGAFWLFGKAFLAVLVQMWVRWTLPRIRIGQMMYLCWKVLTPAGLLLLLISAVWRLLMI